MPVKPANPQLNFYGPRADRVQALYGFHHGNKELTVFNFGPLAHSEGLIFTDIGGTKANVDAATEEFWIDAPIDNRNGSGAIEGRVLNLGQTDATNNEQLYLEVMPLATNVKYERGTILLKFRVNVDSSDLTIQPILNSGGSNSQNYIRVFKRRVAPDESNSTHEIRITKRSHASSDLGAEDISDLIFFVGQGNSNEEAARDFDDNFLPLFHTLIITWGEEGFKGWLDGKTHDKSDEVFGPLTDTRHIVFAPPLDGTNDGGYVINRDSTLGGTDPGLELSAFCQWDVQLIQREVDELIVDHYLSTRPPPDAQFYTTAGPVLGRPTETTATLRFVTKEVDGSEPVYLRVTYSTDRQFSTTSQSQAVPVPSINNNQINLVLGDTGVSDALTPGTEYFYYVEYSSTMDFSINVETFPMGIGRFVTQRDSADESSFSFIIYGDDHIGNDSQKGLDSNSDIEDYFDNAFTGFGVQLVQDAQTNNARTQTGYNQKWFAAWRANYDIYKNQSPDFIIHVGDFWMPDSHNPSGTRPGQIDPSFVTWDSSFENAPIQKLKKAHVWTDGQKLLNKSAAMFYCLGNHEGEAGYLMRGDSGNSIAMQKQSTYVRKLFFPNPTNTTYPEGGEFDTEADWIPTFFTFTNKRDYIFEDRKLNLSEGKFNKSPLENFYAFTWGKYLLVVVLDVFRYTDPGDANGGPTQSPGLGSHTRFTPEWEFGDLQKEWAEEVLRNSNHRWKIVVTHQLAGGEEIAVTTDVKNRFYGRGSGIRLAATDELWLHSIAQKTNVEAIIKGHDHKFAHVLHDTMTYITVPTVGAPTHTDPSSDRGWHFSAIQTSYGTAESLGAIDGSGTPIPKEMIVHYNVMGYIKCDVTKDKLTFTLRQTYGALDPELEKPTFAERWVGPSSSKMVIDSANQVVVSEIPDDVVAAFNVDAVDTNQHPNWWDDYFDTGTRIGNAGLYFEPEEFREYPSDEDYADTSVVLTESSDFSLDDGIISIGHVPRSVYSLSYEIPGHAEGQIASELLDSANIARQPGEIIGQICNFTGLRTIHKATLNMSVTAEDRKTFVIGSEGALSWQAINFQSARHSWVFQPALNWVGGWKTSGTTVRNTLQDQEYLEFLDAVANAPMFQYRLFFDQPGVYDMWGYGYVDGDGIWWGLDGDVRHLQQLTLGLDASGWEQVPRWSKFGNIFIEEGGTHTFEVYLRGLNNTLLDQWYFTKDLKYENTLQKTGFVSPITLSVAPYTTAVRLRSLNNGILDPLDDPIPGGQSITAWLPSKDLAASGKFNYEIRNSMDSSGVNFYHGVSIEFWQLGGSNKDFSAWNFIFTGTEGTVGSAFKSIDFGQNYLLT